MKSVEQPYPEQARDVKGVEYPDTSIQEPGEHPGDLAHLDRGSAGMEVGLQTS